MIWRRRHHLSDDVYRDQRHVVFITTCTADRSRGLGDERLAGLVLDEIMAIHKDHPILAYCIMPDHLHLLICNAGSSISRIMNLLKGRVSRRIRQVRPEMSRVWLPSYWDHIVRKEEGLYRVLKYTLMNPVRAELVERWWEYPWLGSPMIGPVGPAFFAATDPEDIMWGEVLRLDDPEPSGRGA